MQMLTLLRKAEPFPTLSHLPQGSLIRFGKDLLTLNLSYNSVILELSPF